MHPAQREDVLGAREVRRDRHCRARDHRAGVGVGDRSAGIDRRRGVVLGVGQRAARGVTSGGSATHVTVTETVAVEPPGVSVYVNVSGEVPGGLLQEFAFGV